MRVGPYEILEEAGRGGRGVVLKARAADGAVVAIKILQASSDPQAFARFDRERRLLAAFGRGEGFVPLLDAGTAQGSPYIVMPFLEGGTLRARLVRGALPLPEAVELVQRLAVSMATAHVRGIIHRDLKPENILFSHHRGAEYGGGAEHGSGADSSWGVPLIADLGLGKHFRLTTPGASQSILLSKSGQLRGTIGYMAPEQARDAMSVGPPADVFSLGAILHECVTGEFAFPGETPIEVLTKIERGSYDRRRRSEPWIEAIVARALAPDPARRFADAGELATALARGPLGLEEGPSRRSRKLVLAGAGVVLVLLALAALATTASRGPAGDPRGALVAARAAKDPLSRLEAAKRALELLGDGGTGDGGAGDDAARRALRGEAFEIAARARLDTNDAAGAFAAAREALALGPDLEARQLLVAQTALRAGRPDDALAAVAKRLAEPTPPLEALRAAAAAHLANGRFADAEAAAVLGISMHGQDPGLLLAKGRALRGLGRPIDAMKSLAAAERAGERDARSEHALAAIEAVHVDPCRDPREHLAHLDTKLPTTRLDAETDTLMGAIEKEWPAARSHPQAQAVALGIFEKLCSSVAKARSLVPKNPEKWRAVLDRVKRVHALLTRDKGPETAEMAAILAALCCYANELGPAEQCFERSATLRPRVRFALRATLGIALFVPISGSNTEPCRFGEASGRGLRVLDAALTENATELAAAEQDDLFLRELHRNLLRVHAWALWRHANDPVRAERSGRAALEIPSAFVAFGQTPVLVAYVPALLLQGKLDEAEKHIRELEAFLPSWQALQASSREMGQHGLSQNWGEVFELRGDLELRRERYDRAAAAFERATRELDDRSSWLGLARARRALGDETGALEAESAALAESRRASYLIWLER